MTWWILGGILLLYLLYTVVAELVLHIWHIGTLHRGSQDERTLALTFDDGPDPVYTPQVLDILKQHQVRATFFLVGKRAVEYPQLIRRMVEEGHEIGSHSFTHVHAWARSPIGTFRDIARAKATMEALTGKPLRYYRSPWGAMNFATACACKLFGLRQTLWSVRAVDWKPGNYADEVVYRVVSAAHPGAIVLCHDAGGAEGAPKNIIQALPIMIQHLRNLGFSFSTIGELDKARIHRKETQVSPYAGYPVLRRMLIAVWQLVEAAFTRIYHVHAVDAIFRISKATWHHGPRIHEQSGEILVQEGAKALDLHFQNETLLTFSNANDNRALIRGLRMTKAAFADIARVLEYHPDFRDVDVVMAVTLMNRGIEMLGFHVEELPDTREKRRLQMYMRFLMGMYHPQGFTRLRRGSQSLALKLVWMTRCEIIERYGCTTSTISG